jgi:hypothetical protein
VSVYRGFDASYSRNMSESASMAIDQMQDPSASGMLTSGFEATASRFSDILAPATIRDNHSVVQEEVGSSLTSYLVSAAIPRLMWKQKPNPGNFGNSFGRAYGLIAANDLQTSVAVGVPTHAYMRGGWLGVLILMLLAGAMYKRVNSLMLTSGSTTIDAVKAAISFRVMISIGTILPLGFIGLLKSLLVTFGILLAVGALQRQLHLPQILEEGCCGGS